MKETFVELLSNKNRKPIKPYDFQLRVAELLLKGRNVVLTAPTGSGKTMTALFPFLYARRKELSFADRLIYALPLRTLASSLYESTKSVISRFELTSTIQMGNQPNDSFFEGDVIFTTIDQLLSSYIGLPYGTSKRSANISPGALIGSYIVIDEFHLLSFREALPTFLDMMDRLSPYIRFLVMTATAPQTVVQTLERHLKGQAVALTKEEQNMLPNCTRYITWSNVPLSASEIVRKHQGGRTLVVVNRVEKAQQLFFQLDEQLSGANIKPEVKVLHSTMFQDHREEVEKWILKIFSKNSTEEGILIATQVVEAGLDISADVLLTDLCPANSLIQRIGRCARFPDEEGNVYVYSVREGDEYNFLPYASKNGDQQDIKIMLKTEELLQHLPPNAKMTPELEETWISEVHEPIDQKRITETIRDLFIRSKEITNALITGNADTSGLVRSIDNVSIILHPDPKELDLRKKPQVVSISRGRLRYFLHTLAEDNKYQWEESKLVFIPEFPDSQDYGEEIQWRPIKRTQEALQVTLLVLAPQIANYHNIVGLLLGESGLTYSKYLLDESGTAFERYSYLRETYMEHIKEVRDVHRKEKEKYSVASKYIASTFQLSAQKVDELSELTTALHDVGKLGVEFQRKVRLWQADVKNKQEHEFLAHTDFDAENQFERRANNKSSYKRPPHAGEGAIALQEWVGKEFRDKKIAVPLLVAILRHHNAFSERSEPIVFAKGAREHVIRSLQGLHYEPFLKPQNESHHFDNLVTWLQDRNVLAFYWYLVRRLRLSDRRSQQNHNNKLGLEGKNDEV
ncbi:CRISPR-associated helicase Cas3' [Fodinisporobacter ferrooxydans]|uniref:CRISPR-associated helicase Cas3 n=1 Tax=Fodinisporobacter ferrooxydans TaxID=2901836 RepID=A0ABY4CKV0_9BACL|nr:CRISPR-associated helicase Cas3' [Alicyclobacillaceae bacterium MYW30-H2]